jgi:hypothetical protein
VAVVVESVEIRRRPEEVFAYLDDPSRHGEWQEQIVSVDRIENGEPTKVGTRVTETRQIGSRRQQLTYEISEHDPPRAFAFRGLDGPVRPLGRGTIEPRGDGSKSVVTIELDFEGHGLGRLLLPLVRSQARKQVPKDQQRLKQRLEQDHQSD